MDDQEVSGHHAADSDVHGWLGSGTHLCLSHCAGKGIGMAGYVDGRAGGLSAVRGSAERVLGYLYPQHSARNQFPLLWY